ncbi:hypothetical protein ABZ354_02370 [Streptomyces sp. NPDC005925]|uniref:hypothetical protein n=1 Tax=unclassified Streptomyces TaxID=2593676 RepID=UPI0033FC90A9
MTCDDLRDVWRQTIHDGVSDEDPSEVMRLVVERLAGVVGQASEVEGRVEGPADRGFGDRPVLAARAPLEEQGHGRVPDLLADVV